MNKAFRCHEVIPASPRRVWDVLTNWETAPRWMGSVSLVQPVDGTGQGPGAALRVQARGNAVESRIEAWEPARLLSLVSTQGGVTARYDYRLEPSGPDTRVVLEARCFTRGKMWGAVSPIIRLAMRWTDGGQLRALRRLVAETVA